MAIGDRSPDAMPVEDLWQLARGLAGLTAALGIPRTAVLDQCALSEQCADDAAHPVQIVGRAGVRRLVAGHPGSSSTP